MTLEQGITASTKIHQNEHHAVISDDEAQSDCLEDHLTSDLLRFLEDHIDESSTRVQDESSGAYSKLLDHFSDTNAKLTVAFSNISGSHISWDHDLSSRELSTQSSCNALQQQRFLHLPHTEYEAEKTLFEVQQDCKTRNEDLLGYAKESLTATAEEDSSAFRIVVLVTVSVVIVPWVLFVGLYLFNVLALIPGWLQAALVLLIPHVSTK